MCDGPTRIIDSKMTGKGMQIDLYMTTPATESLGPFKRYALWVQGCNKRCKGCISPDAQPLDKGTGVSVEDLATDILSVPEIEGITISGGEPFLQQESLAMLVDLLRSKRDLGVIVYTGMRYSEIKDTPLAQRCDLIIDGEYIEDLNDDKSLRGSSNQSAICITDRYEKYVKTQFGIPGRKVEFIVRNQQVDMIGIPPKYIVPTIGDNDYDSVPGM